jgi:hypothetical protein
MAGISHRDAGADDRFRSMFGPGQVDQAIRQALQMCWMMLPKEQQTPDQVEAHFRRLVERALKDLREDGATFPSP